MSEQRVDKLNNYAIYQRDVVQINNITVGYLQAGEIAHPQQTLVLLHGFTGSAENWLPLFPQLAAPRRRLLALDMLGHGLSSSPTDPMRYTMEHCQHDILAVLYKLGVIPGEAVLLGYSMGGRIALGTALARKFRGLILESASPGLVDPADRAQRQQSDSILADRIELEGVPAFITWWEQIPLFASQRNLPPDKQAALHAQRLRNNAQGLANSLRGVGTGVQPALHGRLSELTCPTLLLTGSLDQKFCQIAQEMLSQLPQAQHTIVPDAGHTIHLEQPEIFATLANTFLKHYDIGS